ncbi:retrovirus-related pol polyprotein from transposon TNT 1-94 [Tanacetum coccineum]|uniref:Retrovirus-related pol polyprotein from transposon TNT 1-94 n=1 Tax=Tanacetum coccineum TaxID=301880 RepID=A0ABQ5FTI9_9ASTR
MYRIKFKADGSIERFKARVVSKGLNQKEGIYYKETFAPVAKMVSDKALTATATHHNWDIEELDVSNAFLHGDLDEQVYMTVPQGYSSSLPPNSVCKLKKSLYGLKQANRQWFIKLTDFLKGIGFHQSYADTSLFTLTKGSSFTALLIYVDDILINGSDKATIQSIKQQLDHTFSIKDLGSFHYYLGIEILQNSKELIMSQRKYALDLLQCANMLNHKPFTIPLDPIKTLNSIDGIPLDDPSLYRKLVGKLIYLTITRPDLSFTAQAISQFSHQPRTTHMVALYKVLRYIKLCPSQGLHFPKGSPLHLSAYCDSDWAACPITRRSVSGYAVFLGPCLISWTSKKQSVVSRSSIEA